MGVTALVDCFAYAAGHDFTTDTNRLLFTQQAEAKDRTTFGSGGWREFNGGLKTHKFDMAGFWQSDTADAVDPEAFPDLGAVGRVLTFGVAETEGQPCYMVQASKLSYELGGRIGDNAPFKLTGQGSDGQGVIRGGLAKARGSVSATGAIGTGQQLGAVGAAQYLYATFHVFSAGTTITVVVESDDNSGFTTATTRHTFGPITTRGGTWATRVAGPITDTWWRLRVTAITGTFIVAGAIGIQ